MPLILDLAYDAGLDRVCDLVENFYITSTEATNYTEAFSTFKLGTKATPTINAAEAGASNGRRRRIQPFSDGTVDSNGTADSWAMTDNSITELLCAAQLSSGQVVTLGNTFSITETDVAFADAT